MASDFNLEREFAAMRERVANRKAGTTDVSDTPPEVLLDEMRLRISRRQAGLCPDCGSGLHESCE